MNAKNLKTCSNCQSENPQQANFCRVCGARFSDNKRPASKVIKTDSTIELGEKVNVNKYRSTKYPLVKKCMIPLLLLMCSTVLLYYIDSLNKTVHYIFNMSYYQQNSSDIITIVILWVIVVINSSIIVFKSIKS